MADGATKTSIAVLAPAVQQSVTSIWTYYVHPIMPGLADTNTAMLVGICAAILVAQIPIWESKL